MLGILLGHANSGLALRGTPTLRGLNEVANRRRVMPDSGSEANRQQLTWNRLTMYIVKATVFTCTTTPPL